MLATIDIKHRVTIETYFNKCKAIIVQYLGQSINTKIIYTAIFGMNNYQGAFPIHEPNIDYVCFTDNPNIRIQNYTQIVLPTLSESIMSDQTHKCKVRRTNASKYGTLTNRAFKILIQEVLPERYTWSIYHDGHYSLCMTPTDYWATLNDGHVISVHPHPDRTKVDDEIRFLIKRQLTSENLAQQTLLKFQKSGFTNQINLKTYPLTANNVLIRKHTTILRELSWAWFTEFITGIPRDQVSLQFVAWILHVPIKVLPPKEACRTSIPMLCNKIVAVPAPKPKSKSKPKPKPKPNRPIVCRTKPTRVTNARRIRITTKKGTG